MIIKYDTDYTRAYYNTETKELTQLFTKSEELLTLQYVSASKVKKYVKSFSKLIAGE